MRGESEGGEGVKDGEGVRDDSEREGQESSVDVQEAAAVGSEGGDVGRVNGEGEEGGTGKGEGEGEEEEVRVKSKLEDKEEEVVDLTKDRPLQRSELVPPPSLPPSLN